MNNFRNTVAMLALLCASGVAYAQESTPAHPRRPQCRRCKTRLTARRQELFLKRTFPLSARLQAALRALRLRQLLPTL